MEENKVVKLAKNGELTEKLMQDKDFVEKAKKILKKENIDGNEIFEILKILEKCINKSEKIKSEEDLENVIGGRISRIGELYIKSSFTILGTAIGALPGAIPLAFITEGDLKNINFKENAIPIAGAAVGATVGGMAGAAFGQLIVNTINRLDDRLDNLFF
ncbi:MAG: hypothetical protein RsTaC01_0942 [Candidatus Paraimprobicoccus trichonymphae]|uniref:Uncharacterized protein n=1 Tax=Candidatus Paraimprobicoccus trichonymphae TaxID=3033793 RepID=A0AA48HX48_9FIRM|nr:MAG: hypothetical protein RsTaC01_0942 [Candidatus Paraimprobicoccus trichonymphae]